MTMAERKTSRRHFEFHTITCEKIVQIVVVACPKRFEKWRIIWNGTGQVVSSARTPKVIRRIIHRVVKALEEASGWACLFTQKVTTLCMCMANTNKQTSKRKLHKYNRVGVKLGMSSRLSENVDFCL